MITTCDEGTSSRTVHSRFLWMPQQDTFAAREGDACKRHCSSDLDEPQPEVQVDRRAVLGIDHAEDRLARRGICGRVKDATQEPQRDSASAVLGKDREPRDKPLPDELRIDRVSLDAAPADCDTTPLCDQQDRKPLDQVPGVVEMALGSTTASSHHACQTTSIRRRSRLGIDCRFRRCRMCARFVHHEITHRTPRYERRQRSRRSTQTPGAYTRRPICAAASVRRTS